MHVHVLLLYLKSVNDVMCEVDSGWPKKPRIRRGLDLTSGSDTFEEACPGQLSIIWNIWHEKLFAK